MVRRRLIPACAAAALLGASACGMERDLPERAETPDTAEINRAMHDPAMRDSMLDVMPGGEMARGDSAASMRLLEKKR
jgi:hypothetical protein